MELIPAIDLLDGKAVRLHKGDYGKATIYNDNPETVAKQFLQMGATSLHVIDLDGAKDGTPHNASVVEKILAAAPELKIQIGGGIRSSQTAERWLDAGASKIVLGTAAIKNPDWAAELCAKYPQQIIVAVDGKSGKVAVEGWLQTTSTSVSSLAKQAEDWGASDILFTNIAFDGTGEGPDIDGTAKLQSEVKTRVIASGGIGSLEHISALKNAGLKAAVCGKAIYSGAFKLEEAFAIARGEHGC